MRTVGDAIGATIERGNVSRIVLVCCSGYGTSMGIERSSSRAGDAGGGALIIVSGTKDGTGCGATRSPHQRRANSISASDNFGSLSTHTAAPWDFAATLRPSAADLAAS